MRIFLIRWLVIIVQKKMPPKRMALIFNYKRMEKKLSFLPCFIDLPIWKRFNFETLKIPFICN